MLTQSSLDQFTGTEKWYSHWSNPNKYFYTDGVQYLADEGQAYWLLDCIFSWQLSEKVRSTEFQVWTLDVLMGYGTLYMTDGRSDEKIVEQTIPYTDFPLSTVKLYFENNVLCLPRER